MTAPCGGCPPHCASCVFASKGTLAAAPRTIVPKEAYGCVRKDGGPVVVDKGVFGMMRGNKFHPVTTEGAAFLRDSGNALGTHC